MKRIKYSMLLHFLCSVITTFVVIYTLIFVGGWRLFEPMDPILLEIAASIVIGFIIWLFYEITRSIENKITELEKRIIEIENLQSTK